jgi:transposase
VLFPVNPATVAKYRQAFTPSHAKDDPSDAELQLELLLRHRDKLKPLKPEGVAMRTLRCLVEERRGLVDDRVRITNQLTYAAQAVLPPGARLVPGQRHARVLRFPGALADAQTRAARPQGEPDGVLPRAPRALRQRHRRTHRRDPERHAAH